MYVIECRDKDGRYIFRADFLECRTATRALQWLEWFETGLPEQFSFRLLEGQPLTCWSDEKGDEV